jgi:hypothetical protein
MGAGGNMGMQQMPQMEAMPQMPGMQGTFGPGNQATPMQPATQPMQQVQNAQQNIAATGQATTGASPQYGGGQKQQPMDPNLLNGTFNPGQQGGFPEAQQGPTPVTPPANPYQNMINSPLFDGSNPGQGVVDALRPQFEANLQNSLGMLRNTAPSIFNSAMHLQGADISEQANRDFNTTAAQALQQGVTQGQAGMQAALGGQLGLTQLAQNQQQFESDFGLRQNQQMFNQQVMPALQMLMQYLGMAGPTGLQTVVGG